MKKVLGLLLCSSLITLQACNKATDPVPCGRVEYAAPASEVFALQSYLSSAGINATADDRGFFYVISRTGSSVMPTACSTVSISYTLRLTNGTQVEASGGSTFNLGNLILGWQEGLPLIGEGGSITLYLPPSLAYGAQGSGGIPANSITIFQIDLFDVQ
jgi:FKBP-type peptidyl-prolyl cis-trans isomerase FkpA